MAAAAGFKFPEALTKIPRCFIAFSGLDIKNNAVHRAVWDEFTTGGRRAERKPVLYKDVPADHFYPKCSEKVRMDTAHSLHIVNKVIWLLLVSQASPNQPSTRIAYSIRIFPMGFVSMECMWRDLETRLGYYS